MDPSVLALIATIIFVLIAVFLIPLLIQIKNTVQRFDDFLGVAERDIVPLLRELREISEHVKNITVDAERDISKISPLFDSLEEAGGALRGVAQMVNSGVGRAIGTWLGVRAAKKAFKKELKSERR